MRWPTACPCLCCGFSCWLLMLFIRCVHMPLFLCCVAVLAFLMNLSVSFFPLPKFPAPPVIGRVLGKVRSHMPSTSVPSANSRLGLFVAVLLLVEGHNWDGSLQAGRAQALVRATPLLVHTRMKVPRSRLAMPVAHTTILLDVLIVSKSGTTGGRGACTGFDGGAGITQNMTNKKEKEAYRWPRITWSLVTFLILSRKK